jgi:hypothetical protein
MNYEVLKSSILEALRSFSDDVKLAGIVTDPDYSKGEMDASNEAISSGKPVSKLPTKFTDARTYPGHSGKDAPMKEKLENADGIDPKDWDEKKHGRKLASAIIQQVMEEISSGSDLSVNEIVTKCVRETIKKNLAPKETKMDEQVQGTAKPEKGDDDAAGKMVDEKAKKMKGKGDTKKSLEEDPDMLKSGIKMPKSNPYMDHYEKFGEAAPQGARAAEVNHAVSTNKPLKENLEEEDAKKAFSDDAYDKADHDYHSEVDRKMENMSDEDFDKKVAGQDKLHKDLAKKNQTKKSRKPGGMSDEALDWGEDDEEAAKNWDKKEGKKETKKGVTFKSFSEAQAWENPDPSLYIIRGTTSAEKREYGPRMRFIVDEVVTKEKTGSFGNRLLKGAKFNPKKDTLLGDKKLMPKNTVVHDVKNPSKNMDKQFDAAEGRPATVLATRHKGPKGESVVTPPHSHSSEEPGFADSEASQKELRKGVYGKDRKLPTDAELEPRNYMDSSDRFDDAGNYIKPAPKIKVTKEQAELPFKGRGAVKSLLSEITQEVMKSKFWEDKVIHREDKQLAAAAKKEPPKEEKASKKLRGAVLSGDAIKSVVFDVLKAVIESPEFEDFPDTFKAELRDQNAWGKPVTQASSDWVSRGEKVDKTGTPTHQKKDETPKISDKRHFEIVDSKAGHKNEIEDRDSKAQSYLASKKKAIKSIVEEVLKGYGDKDEWVRGRNVTKWGPASPVSKEMDEYDKKETARKYAIRDKAEAEGRKMTQSEIEEYQKAHMD